MQIHFWSQIKIRDSTFPIHFFMETHPLCSYATNKGPPSAIKRNAWRARIEKMISPDLQNFKGSKPISGKIGKILMLVRNLGSTWGRIRVHPAIWMHRYLPPDSQYNMAVTCFPGEALSTTGAVNSWNCPRFSEKFSAYASALKEIPASTVRRNSTNRVPLESPPVSKLSHKYWKTLTIFYLKCASWAH